MDSDPVTVLHVRVMLRSAPEGRTAFFQADARDTAMIVEHAAATLDFRKPVAVILFGVLHFVPDEDEVAGIVAALSAAIAVAPGHRRGGQRGHRAVGRRRAQAVKRAWR